MFRVLFYRWMLRKAFDGLVFFVKYGTEDEQMGALMVLSPLVEKIQYLEELHSWSDDE